MNNNKLVNALKELGGKEKSAETSFMMARLGIVAVYSPEGSSESLFLVENGEERTVYLAQAGASDVEVSLVDSEHKNYEVLKPIIEAVIEKASAELNSPTLNLSDAVIEGQLISGSHTHDVMIGSDGIGYTDDSSGHVHYVEYGSGYTYVSPAPITIAGIQLMHTHMPVVTPKVGV